MIREEKRWITPDPVVLPEFVGEVQEETTADAVAGEDLTIDGDGGKDSLNTGGETETETETVAETVTETATEPSTETATEPATAPTTEPVLEPRKKPRPATVPATEPATKPAYNPSPVLEPRKKPRPATVQPISNKAENTAPKKKISDFFGELSAAATGGKTGVEGSVETLKRVGIGTDTAHKIVKGTQILGKAEAGALLATGAVAMGSVYGPAVVSKGAQTLDDLIEAAKAGRTSFGGAY